jgi:hypothetical protein
VTSAPGVNDWLPTQLVKRAPIDEGEDRGRCPVSAASVVRAGRRG